MRPIPLARFDRDRSQRIGLRIDDPSLLVAPLLDHLKTQEVLCAELETLADELPDRACRQRCLSIARMIGPIVKRAHRFEESELFPLLRARAGRDETLGQTLTRLQFEHFEDESYADEIAEALTSFVAGCERTSAEALGYMLRGFFESMRRHIAFEREHILPLMKQGPAGACHA